MNQKIIEKFIRTKIGQTEFTRGITRKKGDGKNHQAKSGCKKKLLAVSTKANRKKVGTRTKLAE